MSTHHSSKEPFSKSTKSNSTLSLIPIGRPSGAAYMYGSDELTLFTRPSKAKKSISNSVLQPRGYGDEKLEVDAGHRSGKYRQVIFVEKVVDGQFHL